jgi:hypothetical protein
VPLIPVDAKGPSSCITFPGSPRMPLEPGGPCKRKELTSTKI